MEISPSENIVLLQLLQGVPMVKIARQLHSSYETTRRYKDSLITKGVIEKIRRGQYKLLVTSYTVVEAEPTPEPIQEPVPYWPSFYPISHKLERQIRQRYKRMPRSQIANELGIHKFHLNMMIMQLKLSGG